MSKLWDKIFGKKKENPVFTTEDEIRIAILGKTGAGKSETGNTILGSEEFESDLSGSSVTKNCGRKEVIREGKKVILIDTPGLFDTGISPEETKKEIAKCVGIAAPGVHCFLVVIQMGRFTDEEYKTTQEVMKLFGENAQRYVIVLFTKIDLIKGNDPVEEKLANHLRKAPTALNNFLSDCDMRYVGFNNAGNKKQKKQQVKSLFDLIEIMVSRNGGTCYTSDMFQEAERKIQEFIEKEIEEKRQIQREYEEKLREEIEKEEERKNKKKLEDELEKLKRDTQLKEKRLEEEIRDQARTMIQNEDKSFWSKITGGVANFISLLFPLKSSF